MSLQSSGQDSSLEEEQVKRDDKPSSSHLWARSGTIQTKRNPATTYWCGEKYTIITNGSLIRTPSTGSTWQEHKRRGTAVLADKVSRHNCSRFSAVRCVERVVCQKGDNTFIWKTLSASARSKDSSQGSMEIKAAAARAAAAGHWGRLRETASGANPRYTNRQPKSQKLRETVARYWVTCCR